MTAWIGKQVPSSTSACGVAKRSQNWLQNAKNPPRRSHGYNTFTTTRILLNFCEIVWKDAKNVRQTNIAPSHQCCGLYCLPGEEASFRVIIGLSPQ